MILSHNDAARLISWLSIGATLCHSLCSMAGEIFEEIFINQSGIGLNDCKSHTAEKREKIPIPIVANDALNELNELLNARSAAVKYSYR